LIVLNRLVLSFVFTLSFLTFLAPELSIAVQLTPLIVFAVLVFFRVFCSGMALTAVESLFELDGLIFVILLSLLVVAPSFESKYDKSVQFSLFFVTCLFLARLYMAVVPVREVFEAFFWSGILSVGLLVPLSFGDLLQSMETLVRFSFLGLEDNLLAFLLAGYLSLMVWKFFAGGWRIKILTGIMIVFSVIAIFFTSSRGALAGTVVGGGLILALRIVRALREHQTKVVRQILATSTVLLLIFFLNSLTSTKNAYDFVDRVLSLSTAERGVDSGFSGRIGVWRDTLTAMSGGKWLLGRGLRSSDSMAESQMIDNSYIVILYELGIVPLVLIVGRFAGIWARFVWSYFHALRTEQRRFYLACSALMTMFFVINFVDRLLFSVGNPFSLFVFLLFAAPTSQITPKLDFERSDPETSSQRVAPKELLEGI
jgi:O-antigen ligase